MPNVSQEFLNLRDQVARHEERLDYVRREIEGLVELRVKVGVHESQWVERAKRQSWVLTAVTAVISSLIGGVAGALATKYLP